MAMLREETMARLTPKQRKLVRVLQAKGTLADLARNVSRVTKKPVAWETVYGWVRRGSVPKHMLLPVQKVTGARIDQLL